MERCGVMFRDERIANYLGDGMTPEQRAAFEREIVNDPEGLAELVAQKCIDSGLQALSDSRNARVEAAIMATVRSVSVESATNRILADTVRARRKPRFDLRQFLGWLDPACWRPWMLRVAVTGIVLLIGWGFWIFRPESGMESDDVADATPPGPVKGFAQVTGGAGVVWAGDETGIGSFVSQNKIQLRSGIIEIQFTNGASMILEGPAEIDLLSPLKTELSFGRLSATVPPSAHGFSVHAGGVEVVDLGTVFGINKPPAGPVEVHVFTGKVEVTPDISKKTVELAEGKAMRLEMNSITPLPANRAGFATETELQQRQAKELSAHYDAWKQLNAGLDRDPTLLVHYDFLDRATNLINRSIAAGPETGGQIIGCDWVNGRWPGKSALRFSGRGDRIHLKVPGQFESLTCATWVSLDSLDRPVNALVMSQTFKPGEVQWDITASGIIQFYVRKNENENGSKETISSARLVKSKWFDRWVHLAAVYDKPGMKTDLYLNGELVASRRLDQAVPLVPDELELGNWAPLLTPPPSRNERRLRERPSFQFREFQGRIDEFMLLSRPLSADEIRRLYEAGRPCEEKISR
jgi:Concanavalin A-like lectin/glucanases superfamily